MSYMLLYIIIIIETYSKNEIKKFKKKKHTQIVLFIYIYIHTYIYIYTINYIRIHTQQHLLQSTTLVRILFVNFYTKKN